MFSFIPCRVCFQFVWRNQHHTRPPQPQIPLLPLSRSLNCRARCRARPGISFQTQASLPSRTVALREIRKYQNSTELLIIFSASGQRNRLGKMLNRCVHSFLASSYRLGMKHYIYMTYSKPALPPEFIRTSKITEAHSGAH